MSLASAYYPDPDAGHNRTNLSVLASETITNLSVLLASKHIRIELLVVLLLFTTTHALVLLFLSPFLREESLKEFV